MTDGIEKLWLDHCLSSINGAKNVAELSREADTIKIQGGWNDHLEKVYGAKLVDLLMNPPVQ